VAAGAYRLGVDFGTSNTVAVLAGPEGRVRPLLFDGSPLLASAVFAGPGSGLLVGADAVRAAVGYPAGLEPNPKRRIDDGTVWLGEREYPVVDVVAAVLGRVGEEASRVAGGAAGEVVLTHPVAWGRHRLGLLAAAAARAGLGEIRFVAEPVAAAAYFASVLERRIPGGRCIVVYDLGAGTFDVTVVRPEPGGFDVITSAGLSDVGGLDLDAVVVEHARTVTAAAGEAWRRLDWPQQPADQQARQTLWQAARAVKEQLSRHSTGDLYLPLVDSQVHLTREEFERAARPHLQRTAALTMRILAEAGVPPEAVGGVFLVGGSSRIPLAATLLHRTLRIAPTVIDQPELVVAEGALHSRPGAAQPVTGPVVDPAAVVGPAADPPAAAASRALPAPSATVSGTGPPDEPRPTPPDAGAAAPRSAERPAELAEPEPVPVYAPAPPRPSVSRLTAATTSVRRRPVRMIAALAACVVLATAGILAVTRPWQASPVGGGNGDGHTGAGDALTGHTDRVNGVAFSPNGKLLATVSSDGTTRLWDVAVRSTPGYPLLGPPGLIYSVAFSPDGSTLVTGGDNVRLWEVARRETVGDALTGLTGLVRGLTFSPDGKTIVAGGDRAMRMWDVVSHQSLSVDLASHTDDIQAVAYSPNGRIIATGSEDTTVRLWDAGSRKPIGAPLTGHTGVVHGVAFSPDGGTLATVSGDKTVRLWDVSSHQPIGAPLTGHTGVIYAVAFDPDGRSLATAGEDKTIRRWDARSGQPAGTALTGHSGWIRALAFSPDGTTLASGADDKTVRLWQIAG
jgi:WD40 repeat protein